MPRIDGRANDDLRPVRIIPKYLAFAEGSALIEVGMTKVICAVSVEDKVPPFLKNKGQGWLTAEYSMLPRSTLTRSQRSEPGRVAGRSQEIQRLIGRSLRAVVDMSLLGERTLTIDCDVIQADGGTRTAAITGAYVAVYQALLTLMKMGAIDSLPLHGAVAATSVGIVDGEEVLDLCYEEDYRAEADFNIVMTSRGEFVEIQGTAESKPFNRQNIDSLLNLAEGGIRRLLDIQKKTIEGLKG